jgi:dephospho-CoA kinase
MSKKIIIITGKNGSGKDTAAEYLSSRIHYPVFSIADILREMAKEKQIEPTRENLISINTELAGERGNDALAEELLTRLPEKSIVTGIRIPSHVTYLRSHGEVLIVAVEADDALRFERAVLRGRVGDGDTLEQFLDMEEKENSAPNPQRVHEMIGSAQFYVANNDSLKVLYEKIDEILTKENFIL